MTASYALQLTREFDVSAEKLFKVWTTPERFGEWFCPLPWKVTEARSDLRPGGESFVLMEGPNGEKIPNPGVYLEIVPGRKLVFTDAYTATAVHWNEEDMKAHQQMGFEEGWGIVADQMAEVAKMI
ncbi:SRPBCC domain-containing protein [Neorhizobium sp. LMR1-1-1.1]